MITTKRLKNVIITDTFFIDLIRIVFGFFLFYKGVSFVIDTSPLHDALHNYLHDSDTIAIHYISFAHITGGILIIIGLLTKWSILAQLPFLLGGVLLNIFVEFDFVNFALAFLACIVCVLYFIYGSGKYSADEYLKFNL